MKNSYEIIKELVRGISKFRMNVLLITVYEAITERLTERRSLLRMGTRIRPSMPGSGGGCRVSADSDTAEAEMAGFCHLKIARRRIPTALLLSIKTVLYFLFW